MQSEEKKPTQEEKDAMIAQLTAWYPTQEAMLNIDSRYKCRWFYSNKMKLLADRNNQEIKIRKRRGNEVGHYVEVL